MNKTTVASNFLSRYPRITLLIGGILLGILATEAVSRLVLWRLQQSHDPRIHDHFYFDENEIFRIKPNSQGWTIGADEKPIMVAINSEGLRGRELRKAPRKRIVFTGDSIVFAGGVELEETFVVLLEDQFRGEGQDVEVINAGTTDVGIDQYVLQAKHNRFEKYKPDLIVIGLYLNDSRPPQGFLGENQDSFFMFLQRWPFKYLASTHFLKQGYIIVQQKLGKTFSKRFDWIHRYLSESWIHSLEEFQQTVREARYDWGAGWTSKFQETVQPALKEISEIYSRKGIKFAVVVFPVSSQVYTNITDPFINHPQRQLSKFANETKMDFLDLLPDLKRHKNLWLFVDQCHFNRQGNRTVAKITYPFLKDLLEQKTKINRP